MSRYSIEDRIFIVKNWYQTGESPANLLRRWSSTFKNRPKPSKSTVLDLVAKFERIGTVADDREAMRTTPVTARTPENIQASREI